MIFQRLTLLAALAAAPQLAHAQTAPAQTAPAQDEEKTPVQKAILELNALLAKHTFKEETKDQGDKFHTTTSGFTAEEGEPGTFMVTSYLDQESLAKSGKLLWHTTKKLCFIAPFKDLSVKRVTKEYLVVNGVRHAGVYANTVKSVKTVRWLNITESDPPSNMDRTYVQETNSLPIQLLDEPWVDEVWAKLKEVVALGTAEAAAKP